MDKKLLEFVESGKFHKARLIPSLADSKKEERATSSLLATFSIIPDFANSILCAAGASTSSRSKISCYTEVAFGDKNSKSKSVRPDGLVVIKNGKKYWSALVESKIGNSDLKSEQIQEYLDVAKEYSIDCVITISNQFATTPTHHPVSVPKIKLRSVNLIHFSWLYILSEATMASSNNSIDDPEQSYILHELVRYLEHDASGVNSLTSMGTTWKDICDQVQQSILLKKSNEDIVSVVSSWHQLLRYLGIHLSTSIGRPVKLHLTRKQLIELAAHLSDDVDSLVGKNILVAEFEIPDAASRITFSADFMRKSITFGMKLDAPTDKSRSTAAINWFTRQLKDSTGSDIQIRTYWPNRKPMMSKSLQDAIETPSSLVPDGCATVMPKHIEAVVINDLAGRFRGSKTFIDDTVPTLERFYVQVGQHLKRWVASAPKAQVPDEKTTVTFSRVPDVIYLPTWSK